MGEHNRPINCPWCRSSHGRRFLCDPVKARLDAEIARADADTFAPMEFDEATQAVLGGQQLVRQIVVQGAVIEAGGGTHYPALVFGGRGLTEPLPNMLYVGSDEQLRGIAKLVHELAEMAIRRADASNRGGRRD